MKIKTINKTTLAILCGSLLLSTTAINAAPKNPTPVEIQVSFSSEKKEANYTNTFKGDAFHTYKFNAKAGQLIDVKIESTNDQAITVLYGLDDYVEGETYQVKEDQEIELRVLQMRNFARRGDEVKYTLHVTLKDANNEVQKVVYHCQNDQKLETVNFAINDTNYLVIQQNNELIPLKQRVTASGVGYEEMSDTPKYQVDTKGKDLTLYAINKEKNEDKMLLDCKIAE